MNSNESTYAIVKQEYLRLLDLNNALVRECQTKNLQIVTLNKSIENLEEKYPERMIDLNKLKILLAFLHEDADQLEMQIKALDFPGKILFMQQQLTALSPPEEPKFDTPEFYFNSKRL